jgi:hypothetical protein
LFLSQIHTGGADVGEEIFRSVGWDVQVLSVEKEMARFPQEQESLAFRLSVIADSAMKFRSHDLIQVIVGQSGTPSWASFIATVIEHEPGSLLLFTSLQYESRLQEIVQFKLIFSPLTSITGMGEVIDRLGFLPPFHYAEIIHADLRPEKESLEKTLDIHINDTAEDLSQRTVRFQFAGVHEEQLSSFEEINTLFQLEFGYEGEAIRVVLDAQTGFDGSFLCRKVNVSVE